jgi:hypothetical protein
MTERVGKSFTETESESADECLVANDNSNWWYNGQAQCPHRSQLRTRAFCHCFFSAFLLREGNEGSKMPQIWRLLCSSLLFLLSFLLPEMPLKLSKPQIERFLCFTNA